MKHLISACCIMCIRWLEFPPKKCYLAPQKLTSQWENPPFEDVFPMEHGNFSNVMLVIFFRVYQLRCRWWGGPWASHSTSQLPRVMRDILSQDEDFYGWKGWCGCNSFNQLVYLDGWHYWDMLRLRLTLWKWLCFEEMCSIWSIQFLRMVREFWVKYRASHMIVDEKPYNDYFRFFPGRTDPADSNRQS